MKHRLFAFLLVCALALGLAACTPDGDIPESKSVIAEVSVRVDTPVIGQAVSEYLDSCVSVTVNGTALTRADSTDDTYGGGTQFTAEIWSGYEVGWYDMPYDTFIATDPEYGAMMYYGVRLHYAVSAEYEKAEYTFDTVGDHKYVDETSDKLSADGNWRIYDYVVSFRPRDGIGITQTSISVPAPVDGETVAQANAKISVSVALTAEGCDYFSKESTALTYTDSTDYSNPDTYGNGTRFATYWDGHMGDEAGVYEYSNDHVFSADEAFGGSFCTVTVYYATPAAYPVDYAVTEGTVLGQYVIEQTDEWIIRSVMISFDAPEEALPEVYISAPAISIGETVAAANAGVHVTIDGVELTWIEGESNDIAALMHSYDPSTEFTTVWGFQDAGANGFTPMALNDVFTGDTGRAYVLWIYFSTLIPDNTLMCEALEDPYDTTFVTADSTAFSVDHTATDYFHADGTYWTDRADVYYVLHDHVFTDWVTTVEGSCTTATEKIRTCTVCGYEEGKIIEPEGHSWGDWVRTVKPTCTSEGARVRTCSRCGAQEAEKMAALGHSYTYTRTVGNHHSAVCSRCGDTFEADCTSKDGYCIYCHGIIIIY